MQAASRVPGQRLCVSCKSRAAARTLSASAVPSRRLRQDGRRNKTFSFPYDKFAGEREHKLIRYSDQARDGTHQRVDNPGFVKRSKFQKRASDDDYRQSAIMGGLDFLKRNLHKDPMLAKLNLDELELEDTYAEYESHVLDVLENASLHGSDPRAQHLFKASQSRRGGALRSALTRGLYHMAVMPTFSKEDIAEQQRVADVSYPTEWFPATRAMQRELHLHVGPTNSGKTHHALKRLEEAKSGLYAGPLRLLAHEVFQRLNARGLRCNLITGDDRRTGDDDPDAPMTSCTVEMVPLNSKLDVAVIDEIQMLDSDSRGWAWTQAVLGIQAREMHVCGEERAVPIMQEIAALCGEKLHIHRYTRLSPLKVMSKSLNGDIRNLRSGDCIVCFSIMTIHAIRQMIEKELHIKVAVIYGSLPPETRAQQARLFNDPNSDYQILVASDAVGMGLNLSIKRIIFHASSKWSGSTHIRLPKHEIKQIAGRAGRFSTAQQDIDKARLGSNVDNQHNAESPIAPQKQTGLVSTLEKLDFPYIKEGITAENDPITTAYVFPPASLIDRFSKLFPPYTPFSFIFLRLHELARTNPRFRMCEPDSVVQIADIIEPIEGLSIMQKLIFCSSPVEPRKEGEPALLRAYARMVANREPGTVLDVPRLNLDLLNDNYVVTNEYLQHIEALHKGIVLFLWLSYRFQSIFRERELAITVKEHIEARIEEVLAKMSFDYKYIRNARKQALKELELIDGAGNAVQPKHTLSPETSSYESEEKSQEALDALFIEQSNFVIKKVANAM